MSLKVPSLAPSQLVSTQSAISPPCPRGSPDSTIPFTGTQANSSDCTGQTTQPVTKHDSQAVILGNWWKVLTASFKPLPKVCCAADSIQGSFSAYIVKIQINVTCGIWICCHPKPSLLMMSYSLWQLYSPWALLGTHHHDLLHWFNSSAIYASNGLCCWQPTRKLITTICGACMDPSKLQTQ